MHEQKFTDENEIFLKVEVSLEQYETLLAELDMPADHMFIANYLLCIPIGRISESEQTKWMGRMLKYNKEMTIGPLGTVEYYEKYYAKSV